jgi:cell division protease FtsH
MPKKSRFVLVYIALGFLAILLISHVFSRPVYEIDYGEFKNYLRKGYIKEVLVGTDEIHGKVLLPEEAKEEIAAKAAAEGKKDDGVPSFLGGGKRPLPIGRTASFYTLRILPDEKLEDLFDTLGTKRGRKPENVFMMFLPFIIVFLLLLGFWFLVLRQNQAGRTAIAFGRSRARLYAEKVKGVTFDDVAGCDEAKEELAEVVDFLKNPKKYQSLGGRMPKGVLLVGPPGTGKTLIARAVAGEAKRPFFSLSGSEFVEMFVGVGAARVRDLFQQAKDNDPCIIFIDELDAVGRHRGAGLGGGHDEREQTLNQLLVEMDGFDPNSGIIILAATNRPDVLDPALLRPGRFDRQIVIDAPDLKGRQAILEVHARNKPLAEGINLKNIAAATPGFTGADLANVLNESALLAARRGLEKISQAELEEATERVIAGPQRKSRRLSDEERRRVAYHEAGHALVAALSEHADPVRKISIVPRGHAALGYTMQFPSDDRYLATQASLLDRLKTLLAGRATERLVFDEISTGAQDDLNKSSELARAMVCRFGMSDKIGPVSLGREQRQVFLGRDLASHEERNYSDATAQEIDREVRRIIEEADEAATTLLTKYRTCLEHVAQTLLEKEVIQGEELDGMLEKELAALGVQLPHIQRRKKAALDFREGASDDAQARKAGAEKKEGGKPALKEGWVPG